MRRGPRVTYKWLPSAARLSRICRVQAWTNFRPVFETPPVHCNSRDAPASDSLPSWLLAYHVRREYRLASATIHRLVQAAEENEQSLPSMPSEEEQMYSVRQVSTTALHTPGNSRFPTPLTDATETLVMARPSHHVCDANVKERNASLVPATAEVAG